MSGNGLDIGAVGDLQAIRNRLAQHSRGIDRTDAGLIADCYHPDGTVDYGFFNGPAGEFSDMLAEAWKGQPITFHRTAQMRVKLFGNRAVSESYAIAYVQTPDADGAMKQRLVCGRYLDRHEKRAGEWRLTNRTYVLDGNVNWTGSHSTLPLGPLATHVPAGGQGAADPGLALLAFAKARNLQTNKGEAGMSVPDAAVIDAIIAKQEIADLTMAYCRAVDRADEALLKSVFAGDSVVVAGVFNGNGQEFAAEICKTVKSAFEQTFHSIANQWVEVDGDQAVGETYVLAVCTVRGVEGSPPSEMLTGGRYIDRFAREDGRWRIAERTFVSDWNIQQPSTRQSEDMYAPLDLRGTQGPDDPIYALWNAA